MTDGRRMDGRRLDGYTISSPCKPNGSGELINGHALAPKPYNVNILTIRLIKWSYSMDPKDCVIMR